MAHDNGSRFSYFLVGLGIGAAVGLLFAPRTGEETRGYLRDRYGELRDETRRRSREVRDRAEEYSERGKEFVDRQRESIEAAIDAGKHAYREEKRKV